MSSDHPLYELLGRGAAGDALAREHAYAELSRLITVFVRAGMGRRLRDHRDSIDVCQSIARSFADDHASGNVRFDSDAALIAYLRTVVQSKLAMLARQDGAAKRTPTQGAPPAPLTPAPDQTLLDDEAMRFLDARFTDLDRQAARLRLAGLAWDDIAAQLGQSPEALRKRFSRLADRLTRGDAD